MKASYQYLTFYPVLVQTFRIVLAQLVHNVSEIIKSVSSDWFSNRSCFLNRPNRPFAWVPISIELPDASSKFQSWSSSFLFPDRQYQSKGDWPDTVTERIKGSFGEVQDDTHFFKMGKNVNSFRLARPVRAGIIWCCRRDWSSMMASMALDQFQHWLDIAHRNQLQGIIKAVRFIDFSPLNKIKMRSSRLSEGSGWRIRWWDLMASDKAQDDDILKSLVGAWFIMLKGKKINIERFTCCIGRSLDWRI